MYHDTGLPRRPRGGPSGRASVAAILLLGAVVAGPSAADEDTFIPLEWIEGPAACEVGSVARLDLPEGYQFVGPEGTRRLLELMENPTDGRELGLAMPIPRLDGAAEAEGWFVVFEYDPIGYVRDDEKDDLDAEAILSGIRKGNDRANEIRRRNGWGEITVEGWQIPPYYDEATNHLKWAIRGRSDASTSVNFSTRFLGRGGAMSADLVAGEEFAAVVPAYEDLLAGFSFTPGHLYSEFREGDKVAQYGLTALVAGGAGAIAAKTGLLSRVWKFLVFGVLALLGALRRLAQGLFRRDESPRTRLARAGDAPGRELPPHE